jgi:hypothetical protein
MATRKSTIASQVTTSLRGQGRLRRTTFAGGGGWGGCSGRSTIRIGITSASLGIR